LPSTTVDPAPSGSDPAGDAGWALFLILLLLALAALMAENERRKRSQP